MDPGTSSLAALHEVRHAFGDVQALDGLSLTVEPGEVFGLLGPNGAGKTTAVRVLAGLLSPDSGRAEIGGLDVAHHPLDARRRYGYVPDGAPLYANLSARRHLELVGGLAGMPDADVAREGERLLEALELSERADEPVGGYSRGMRQKAALACALLPRPTLLILDEPLSGLDAPAAAVVKAVLRGWADRGGAVLYTSHLLDVVERVCDRMAVLDGGRLAAMGSLEELRQRARDDGPLEHVFATLTHAEDPEARAARVLGGQ